MAENLVVNGQTYKGAKAVVLTNDQGEQKIYYTDAVLSVNGTTPDENGNVVIEAGGVDQDELTAAVETALTEAKESGAFDGPPGEKGAPGVHIGTDAPKEGQLVWIDTDEDPAVGETATPDLAANEGEEGHILNRTHFVDKDGVVHKLDNKYIDADWMATSEEHIATAEVIPEQKVTSTWSNLQYLLQPGITYDVIINDVVYPCVAWGSGAVQLGNNTSLSKNNYPFCVYWAGGTATMGMFFYDENVFSSPIYLKVTEHSWTDYNKLPEEFLPESVGSVIVRSCTEGSSKKFKITVDDSGTISATEVTE